MKLYATRHGNTNYNQLRLCNADPTVDVYLTSLGVEQATLVSEKLKDAKIELVFVSPLGRTSQTAEIINKYHHVSMIIDPRITDNNTGFEGKSVDEYFAARNSVTDSWAFKPEGAESLYDVRERVESFLNDLKARQYGAVLLVTHQSILRQIVSLMEGLSKEETKAVDVLQGDYVVFDLA